MSKPHKHAALIKAWADGAEIEALDPIADSWFATSEPRWAEHGQYRVRLKPIKWEKEREAFARCQRVEASIDGGKTWVTQGNPAVYSFDCEGHLFRIPHKWQAEMDAQARGEEVQMQSESDPGAWYDGRWTFDGDFGVTYRIKPKTVKTRLRVAAMGDPSGKGEVWVWTASTDAQAADLVRHKHFICWLHDWKEIERPAPDGGVLSKFVGAFGADFAHGESATSIGVFYNYGKDAAVHRPATVRVGFPFYGPVNK